MQFLQFRHAFKVLERHLLAPEVHALYERYKSSTDMRITREVSKFFYSIHMEAISNNASFLLKAQAATFAPKLLKRDEFQEPKWMVHSLYVSNFLLFSPGISVVLRNDSGSKCLLRTTRNADQIECITESGRQWCAYPDKPEPWMR